MVFWFRLIVESVQMSLDHSNYFIAFGISTGRPFSQVELTFQMESVIQLFHPVLKKILIFNTQRFAIMPPFNLTLMNTLPLKIQVPKWRQINNETIKWNFKKNGFIVTMYLKGSSQLPCTCLHLFYFIDWETKLQIILHSVSMFPVFSPYS